MGPKILDLGNPHPRLGAIQKKETSGDPLAVSVKAGNFIYCLSSKLGLDEGRSGDLDEELHTLHINILL